MKFRLPEMEDRSEIMLYIQEHYSHNEKSLSATSSLPLMEYGEWVKKIHDNTFISVSVWGKTASKKKGLRKPNASFCARQVQGAGNGKFYCGML